MPRQQVSRRTLLRSGVGTALLAVTAGLSGCTDGSVPIGGGDGGAGAGELADVPAGTQAVVHADVGDIVSDSQLQNGLDEVLQRSDYTRDPPSVQEGLDRLEQQLGFDPRKLREVTLFGSIAGGAGEPRAAVIVTTELSQSRVESLVSEQSAALERRQYDGTTVYAASGRPSGWAALPGDGELVVGTESAVTGVLDRRAGDADPVSGDLRDGYTATSDGFVRFAATDVDLVTRNLGVTAGSSVVGDVEYVYGEVTRGVDRTLSVTAEMASADAPGMLSSQLQSGLETLRRQARESSADRYPEIRQRMVTILENTTIEQSGTTVTVTVPDGLQVTVAVLAAALASFVLGLGSTQQRTPQAAFDFEWDADSGTLRITHQAGDSIPASALVVRGTGVRGGSVRWDRAGGSASGSVDTQPAVVAGDSLRLPDVPADYEVRVGWQPPEGGTSATLAMDQGPDA